MQGSPLLVWKERPRRFVIGAEQRFPPMRRPAPSAEDNSDLSLC
jgi:hypothetical protein